MLKMPKDRHKYLFNPLTGYFDLVLQFNENRIVTADYNAVGSQFMTYDSYSSSFIQDFDQVVVDEEGNVVVV